MEAARRDRWGRYSPETIMSLLMDAVDELETRQDRVEALAEAKLKMVSVQLWGITIAVLGLALAAILAR